MAYEAEYHALESMDHLIDERTRLQSESKYNVRSFFCSPDVYMC